VRTQPNIRIHILITVAVVLTALWLELPVSEFGILFLTIGLVLVTELVNTAIEVLVDLVSPEHHPKAKVVKDVAAGAVVVAAMVSVAIGLLVLGPPLWNRVFGP
jgi:diacylglycerol kinase